MVELAAVHGHVGEILEGHRRQEPIAPFERIR